MKVTIVGRQMNVWDEMKTTIDSKLGKLDKYFGDPCSATATLSCRRNQKCLEITIVSAGTIFRSEVQDETFRNALDRAVNAIERQIRKNKTRLAKRLRDASFFVPTGEPDEGYEEEPEFRIRTKTFPFKPMSVEEAILQMNLLDHQFFVFEDAVTGNTCVVYARKDGDYGLILPEK